MALLLVDDPDFANIYAGRPASDTNSIADQLRDSNAGITRARSNSPAALSAEYNQRKRLAQREANQRSQAFYQAIQDAIPTQPQPSSSPLPSTQQRLAIQEEEHAATEYIRNRREAIDQQRSQSQLDNFNAYIQSNGRIQIL